MSHASHEVNILENNTSYNFVHYHTKQPLNKNAFLWVIHLQESMYSFTPLSSSGFTPAWFPAFQRLQSKFSDMVLDLLRQNSNCSGEAGIGGSTNIRVGTAFNFFNNFTSFFQNSSYGQ